MRILADINVGVIIAIVVLVVGFVVGITILLLKKYVKPLKEEADKEKLEIDYELAAKEEVDSIIRTSSSLRAEREAWIETKTHLIHSKAEDCQVELDDEDLFFLLMQEKFHDLDNQFLRNNLGLY